MEQVVKNIHRPMLRESVYRADKPNTVVYDLMAIHMLHLFPVLENVF